MAKLKQPVVGVDIFYPNPAGTDDWILYARVGDGSDMVRHIQGVLDAYGAVTVIAKRETPYGEVDAEEASSWPDWMKEHWESMYGR